MLLSYCLDGSTAKTADVAAVRATARGQLVPRDASDVVAESPLYPSSARKLLRMLDRLTDTGFVGALE